MLTNSIQQTQNIRLRTSGKLNKARRISKIIFRGMPCEICGKKISDSRQGGGEQTKYCSKLCKRAAYRKRKGMVARTGKPSGQVPGGYQGRAKYYGGRFDPFDVFLIFERDVWTCQACGRSTPKELRGSSDDLAPELDHIKPLSWGGDHSFENCQCLCRWCNRTKSTILTLFLTSLKRRLA